MHKLNTDVHNSPEKSLAFHLQTRFFYTTTGGDNSTLKYSKKTGFQW